MTTFNKGNWTEPTGEAKAGFGKWQRPAGPYDRFMEEEGIPVFRAIGVSRVQDLPLKPWKRMGGKGTYIQLYGTEGLWGMYLVEVPAGGALNVERHLYEEMFLVIEGRGSTEVWQDKNSTKKSAFEWSAGSLFSVPLNSWHQIINSTSSPALLLAGTTAPNALNLYMNKDFLFNTSYDFTDRYDASADFYRPVEDLEPDPVRGLAMLRTNVMPDIIDCELPLDNRRSPGYRRVEPHMASNKFYLWIAEHETGRYSKAHAHGSAAVLICLKGKGYTYTWPAEQGTHPWETGQTEKLFRQDYEPVGMVSAAPMSGDWFHQHFGVSSQPLRLTAWFGPNAPGREAGRPGEDAIDKGAIDLHEGGTAIPYWEEDPFIRKEFNGLLQQEGVSSRMDESFYRRPEGL
ncbi:MAG: Mannose-6-phosphate isomerase, cupin superfamily [Chloroflexi bacterium]|jgi:quercetin dioxygenase-like cupin family protein|nr:MAG: Mannose-6-phosphate isomerase, cupin superfamily [Chloroflexota bacterium]